MHRHRVLLQSAMSPDLRIPTPASAALTPSFDFVAQNYGMLSNPNMKQIHDKHPAAFAPQPFSILGFFGPQQILQLVWLRELWRREGEVERGTLRYVPWYALGNVMIGVWMFLWVSRDQGRDATGRRVEGRESGG
jgi:hypothetical protein